MNIFNLNNDIEKSEIYSAENYKIVNLIYWGAKKLKKLKNSSSSASAYLDSQILLAYALNCSKEELLINSNIALDSLEPLHNKGSPYFKPCDLIKKFQRAIEMRAEGYSVAAITGKKFFWKSEFIVNKNTFIPRPDTEILIEAVLQEFPYKREALRILELGTGSGCIIISLLLEYKNAFGFGFEKNFSSFLITKENAKLHSIISKNSTENIINNNINNVNHANHVNSVNVNSVNNVNNINDINNRLAIFFRDFSRAPEILCGMLKERLKIELIVSNPPYIRRATIRDLQIEIQKEPKLALDGSFSGILPYISIFKVAQKLLTKNGKIFVEIGDNQQLAITKLGHAFNFALFKNFKDLTGKIRILVFSRF